MYIHLYILVYTHTYTHIYIDILMHQLVEGESEVSYSTLCYTSKTSNSFWVHWCMPAIFHVYT